MFVELDSFGCKNLHKVHDSRQIQQSMLPKVRDLLNRSNYLCYYCYGCCYSFCYSCYCYITASAILLYKYRKQYPPRIVKVDLFRQDGRVYYQFYFLTKISQDFSSTLHMGLFDVSVLTFFRIYQFY